MTIPHKHAAVIKAWADGAKIETRQRDGQWFTVASPEWHHDWEYRAKVNPVDEIMGMINNFRSMIMVARFADELVQDVAYADIRKKIENLIKS